MTRNTNPTTDSDVITSTDVAKVPGDYTEDLTAILLGDEVPEYDDPEAIQRAIVTRILEAESFDDIFGGQGTISSQELLDIPIEVHRCRVMKSSFEDGFGAYMVMDITRLDTGDSEVLTSGARKIMAQVYIAQRRGFLPAKVKIIEAGRAKQGRSAPLAMTSLGRDYNEHAYPAIPAKAAA